MGVSVCMPLMYLLGICGISGSEETKFNSTVQKNLVYTLHFTLCALILYRRRRFINHLLTYLLQYVLGNCISIMSSDNWKKKKGTREGGPG